MSARPDAAQTSADDGPSSAQTLPCLGSLSVNCNINDDRDDYEDSQSNDVESVGDYESESDTFFRVAFGDIGAIEAPKKRKAPGDGGGKSKQPKQLELEPDGCPPGGTRATLKNYKAASFICLLRYVNTLELNKDFLRFYQGIDPFDAEYNKKVCEVAANRSKRESFDEMNTLRKEWSCIGIITTQRVLVKNAHWIDPVTTDKSWIRPADWVKPRDLDAARKQLLVASKKARTSTNDGSEDAELERLVSSTNTPTRKKDLKELKEKLATFIPTDIEFPPAWITAAVPNNLTESHTGGLYEKKFLGPTATEWDTKVDNKYQMFNEKTMKLAWLTYCGYYEQTQDLPTTREAREKKNVTTAAAREAAAREAAEAEGDALDGGTDTPNAQATAGSSSSNLPLFDPTQKACLTQAEVFKIEEILSDATKIFSHRTPEDAKEEQERLKAITQKALDAKNEKRRPKDAARRALKKAEAEEARRKQAEAEKARREQAEAEEAQPEQAQPKQAQPGPSGSTQSTKPPSPSPAPE